KPEAIQPTRLSGAKSGIELRSVACANGAMARAAPKMGIRILRMASFPASSGTRLKINPPAKAQQFACDRAFLGPGSGGKDRSALDFAPAQIVQGRIGLLERVRGRRRMDAIARCESEECARVLSRQIGNGTKNPLSPEKCVWKRRNVAHVD